MSTPNQYLIQLAGTRALVNECDWLLDSSYFVAMGDRVISDGRVSVHVDIARHDTGAKLAVKLEGEVTVLCDRCLAPMMIAVSAADEVKVVYGDHYDDDGETVTIDEREGRIDLAGILFELIALQVPLQHAHRDGECDEQMAGILGGLMVEQEVE